MVHLWLSLSYSKLNDDHFTDFTKMADYVDQRTDGYDEDDFRGQGKVGVEDPCHERGTQSQNGDNSQRKSEVYLKLGEEKELP